MDNTEDVKTFREYFLETKKRKAFHKNLSKWKRDITYLTDVQVAINVSSFITHCLIELEHKGGFIFDAMEIGKLSSHLSCFIDGEVSVESFRIFFIKNYGKYF